MSSRIPMATPSGGAHRMAHELRHGKTTVPGAQEMHREARDRGHRLSRSHEASGSHPRRDEGHDHIGGHNRK